MRDKFTKFNLSFNFVTPLIFNDEFNVTLLFKVVDPDTYILLFISKVAIYSEYEFIGALIKYLDASDVVIIYPSPNVPNIWIPLDIPISNGFVSELSKFNDINLSVIINSFVATYDAVPWILTIELGVPILITWP